MKVRPQIPHETKVLFRGKPATRWKLLNNKQTREKSQVVMRDSVASGK
jgi:hypothetical protein